MRPDSSYEVRQCSCGEKMLMLRHERTGHVAPINDQVKPRGPYPRGNILINLSAGTYRVVSKDKVDQMLERDLDQLRLNHFVTCPDRKEYRRHWSMRIRADHYERDAAQVQS